MAFSYLLAEKFSCSAVFSQKEFAIVSNLRFISKTNFMLSSVEHEKSFIILGPDLNLCWTHMSKGTFSHIAPHIITSVFTGCIS